MNIEADGAGFLLGERRLKELATGVGHVHDNTAEILQILKGMLGNSQVNRQTHYQNVSEIARSINQITKARQTGVTVTLNTGASKTVTRSTGKNITVNTAPSVVKETSNKSKYKQTANTSGGVGEPSKGRVSGGGAKSSSASPTAGRDAKGRFVASAQGINEKVERNGGGGRSYNWNAPDVGGIDPTVDAVRELTTLFSPAKRAFGLMGRGASWIYKRARPKRNEELPGEQKNHNDEVERHNYEERKVLRKILDAINRNQGSGLLGNLARLLGAGAGAGAGAGRRGQKGKDGNPGKERDKKKNPPAVPVPDKDKAKPKAPGKFSKFGKFLGKVPLLGALLGAGMVASDWADQDNGERGAGIGSLAGSAVGGVIGSFAGPVGTFAGGAVGGMIGERVGQKIGDWTNTLKKDNIGGAIVNRWDDTLNGINKFIKESWNKMGLGFGFGMASKLGMGGMMLASYRRPGSGGGFEGSGASNYSDGGAGSPSTYNPNNEVPISKVLETGKGYNVVELADGSVIKQTGNWNWRNRNPGNIERGDYTKGKGHLSLDGAGGVGDSKRFAAFPTMAAGRQAKKDLIFEGKNYKNLDLMGAIARYAPKKENNTAAYQRAVLGAVGSNKRMSDYTAAERETIMNAIEQREGKVKAGKIEVIKPATRKYSATQPQTKPAQQSTNSNGAKPVFVNTAKPANNKNKPLYVSNSPKPKPMAPVQYPKVIQRESSQQQQQPLMVSNQGNISQNVADRDITHAVTGGLGMRTTLA